MTASKNQLMVNIHNCTSRFCFCFHEKTKNQFFQLVAFLSRLPTFELIHTSHTVWQKNVAQNKQ